MRIAIIETAPFGGLLHYSVQLGDALAARGNEVDLITARGNELSSHRGAARMRAVLAPPVLSSEAPPTGALGRLTRRLGIANRLVRAWARILWEVRRGRYDVVVQDAAIDVSVATTGAIALTALPGGPPIAQVCHNARLFNRWSGDERFARSNVLESLLRTAFRRFDLVFMHGERSRAEFEDEWTKAPIVLIPHGDERVFSDEAPPPSAEEHILFFGQLNRIKGLPVLMDAFDLLAPRRPEATLTIAGAPSPQEVDVESIRRWAEPYGGRVELLDRYIPIEDVPALFARARVVAAPYTMGYQSGVIHLAMTMGRAVVASDVGDFANAVADGETGFLVPPGDAQSVSDALERTLADPDLADRLGAAARERVMSHSSWENVAEKVEAALRPLAAT